MRCRKHFCRDGHHLLLNSLCFYCDLAVKIGLREEMGTPVPYGLEGGGGPIDDHVAEHWPVSERSLLESLSGPVTPEQKAEFEHLMLLYSDAQLQTSRSAFEVDNAT